MASNGTVAQNHDLVAALHRLSKNSPKLVRSSTYPAPADPSITIRSWKMNEFKYYNVPSPFPTLARGLFTRWVPDGRNEAKEEEGVGRYSIVARGYDKFFNIGEVPWTNWKALETHTTPPYVLTLKSNGCIIFIAALSPSQLVITSKHSIGPIKGQAQSHAEVGEAWLKRHLESAGKTEVQLAATLWANGWTAVAELCDDSFEEHVLPYAPELTGLHLHGINSTMGAFHTRDPAAVEAFASEWGFIRTAYTTLDTVAQVREFTGEVGKTGTWRGQPIEGFVVRTHVAEGALVDRDAPPYPPGSSFFFKVKFDEPYMMYRDWRELTKSLLSAKPGSTPRINKAKLGRPETRLYKEWVEEEIKRNRKAFDGYTNNQGIIATRERFLKWCKSEGKGKLAQEMAMKPGIVEQVSGDKRDTAFGKTVIVPVAIPGCGKTSIAVALVHLFGFGHTQSDDVKAKKSAPVFLKNVVDLLKSHDVVIADKNNHLVQHRAGLREATAKISPRVRLLALNWALEQPPAIIHRICGDRVHARGDNHQTLRADAHKGHEDVIWMFIDKTEALAANEVDDIVEMDLAEGLEDGFARAVDGVVRVLGLERPSDERIGEALSLARTYTPKGLKGDGQKNAAKASKPKETPERQRAGGKPPRYFGLLPELDLDGVLDGRLAQSDTPSAARAFWDALKKRHRVAARPHVTLVHSNNLPGEQALWDHCLAIHRMPSPPSFRFELGHVVYNDRIMAVTVDGITVSSEGDSTDVEAGAELLDALPQDVKKRLHITIGTRDNDVKPYEAKGLVESWRKNSADVSSVALKNVLGRGRIKGLFS